MKTYTGVVLPIIDLRELRPCYKTGCDPRIAPPLDFRTYACGRWLNSHGTLASANPSYSVFHTPAQRWFWCYDLTYIRLAQPPPQHAPAHRLCHALFKPPISCVSRTAARTKATMRLT